MLRKQWQTVVLKLIRSNLDEAEKKKIQHLLQKAYSANGEGFYVYAPRQKGNVKVQLGYIGRYIRRPAIALHRIEEYDGQYVTYRYHDKKDGQEKRERLTVEEFIKRLIVKVKKTVRRRNWEQRMKEQTGKDPMVCPHCQCYYEYKGEVCLKDGQLKIKYASDEVARACLERMIDNLTSIKTTKTEQKEEVRKPEEHVNREGFRQLHLFAV
ncbi:transposase (fragment) [Candidatus Desulfosporosinus infrequens]|uniref:Transposase n=1 Tax=Candidatus Desulfosporosinus infrequens TaxID=2043169 RepID=A0A2U3LNE1_9FIRM